MSINDSHSKLVETDPDQLGAGAEEAMESSLRYVQSQIELITPSVADGLGPAIADWFDRLRCWDGDLRAREAILEQQAAEVTARRRELARELRRQTRQRFSGAASRDVASELVASELVASQRLATENQVAELQQQFEQLTTALLAASGQNGWQQSDANVPAITVLEQRIEALMEQNEQLASELAHNTVQRSVGQSSDASALLSWEQRKELLYRQYDSETPDATQPQGDGGMLQGTAALRAELASLQQALHDRNTEIAELRALLENRSSIEGAVNQDQELAMGASTFAKMFDGDELVREERTRLKDLQTEWEAKFRDLEIAASIERANLARERRELERQNAELEEQLAHLQQDLRQESIVGPNQSRRWMAKLGLGE